jgi:argonaute-like protein implicated in RNA metabolism and viral defense
MAEEPNKPTIDERLEAVVQTLELVSAMQLQNEKEIQRQEARWGKLDRAIRAAVLSYFAEEGQQPG